MMHFAVGVEGDLCMSDVIYRNVLIEEFRKCYSGHMGMENSDAMMTFKGICNVIKKCPSAEPDVPDTNVGKWIPVSDRLPEDVEIGEEYPTVIFCTKDAVYVGFYEYYLGGRWWTAEDYTVDNVIAWMPLPEPYKGEQE